MSWSRILMEGGRGTPVNPDGVAFYNALIDEMLANGIEPAVTMFHCELDSATLAAIKSIRQNAAANSSEKAASSFLQGMAASSYSPQKHMSH